MITELISEGIVYSTAILDILIILFIVLIITKRELLNKYSRYFISVAFFTVLASIFGSLFYSEILKYPPCTLCWYQRIFMYPQIIILGIGIILKDKRSVIYSFVLSFFGLIISTYQYLIQLGMTENYGICSLTGSALDCSTNFFTSMGYITIPLMALSAFLFLTLLTGFLILRK